MRISDWSSDVCSSDLDIVEDVFAACRVIKDRRIDQRVHFDAGIDRLHRMMPKHIIACARRDCVDILEYAARLPAGRGPAVDSTGNVADEETLIKLDRKSVVSGKSVSVRVDLGGRGIIKKKN